MVRYRVTEPLPCDKCHKLIKRGRWAYYDTVKGWLCFRCGDNAERAEAYRINARLQKRGGIMPGRKTKRGELGPAAGGQSLRQSIIDLYGQRKIDAKRAELCAVCWRRDRCQLLPITFAGTDCVYFGRSAPFAGLAVDKTGPSIEKGVD